MNIFRSLGDLELARLVVDGLSGLSAAQAEVEFFDPARVEALNEFGRRYVDAPDRMTAVLDQAKKELS